MIDIERTDLDSIKGRKLITADYLFEILKMLRHPNYDIKKMLQEFVKEGFIQEYSDVNKGIAIFGFCVNQENIKFYLKC